VRNREIMKEMWEPFQLTLKLTIKNEITTRYSRIPKNNSNSRINVDRRRKYYSIDFWLESND